MTTRSKTHNNAAAQAAAMVVAAVFLLVGILDFVPGVSTRSSELTFAGPSSMAMLLGLFMVSVLHNIVHRLFGDHTVFWVHGLVIDRLSAADFAPVNTADNWAAPRSGSRPDRFGRAHPFEPVTCGNEHRMPTGTGTGP
ncbi:DUF4383 domain-containing protein [Amycolatopsis sp. NPDC004378]